MNRWLALLGAAAFVAACTPSANGICDSDSACKAGEKCTDGICVKPDVVGVPDSGTDGGADGGTDAGTDLGDAGSTDGGSDAGSVDGGGDGGTSDGGADAGTCVGAACPSTLTLEKPDHGSIVGGRFFVQARAQLAPGAVAADVTFTLTAGASNVIGQQIVSVPLAGQVYSGFLVATQGTSGPVTLTAALHLVGGTTVAASDFESLTLDQQAPVVTTTWDGGSWQARSGQFVVGASVSDNLGMASTQLLAQLLDGGSASYNGTISGGGATYVVPAADLAVPGNLAPVAFSLVVTDLAGNTGSTVGLVLRVDDQKPSVSAAADSRWYRAHAPVTATATDGQGAGLDPASFKILVGDAGLGGQVDGGSALFDVDVSVRVPSTFEGVLPYRIVASDLVGNQGDAGGTLRVDVVPPSIAQPGVQTPADQAAGNWYLAHGTDLTVQATLDGGSGAPIDPSNVVINYGPGFVAGALLGNTATFTVPRSIGAGLQGGSNVLIRAADLAGNLTTVPLIIKFDDVAPSVVSVALADGGAWAARTQTDGGVAAAVSAVVTDLGVGVASVQVFSSDGNTGLTPVVTSPVAGSYQLNVDLTGAPAGAAGPYALLVAAQDNFANASSTPASIQIDDAPPVITQAGNLVDTGWHSGLAGSTTNLLTPVVAITDQGSGASTATIALPDGGSINAAATLLSGDTGSGRWQFASFAVPSDSVLNGTYQFKVSAADVVGNSSTATIALNIDNVPPKITQLSAPTDNGSGYFRGPSLGLSDGDIKLSVTLGTGGVAPIASVTALSGTVAGSLQGDGTYLLNIPRSVGAGGGDKVITVTVKDVASNVATQSITLKFEDARPTVSITADNTWYSGSGAAISVGATLDLLPASGIKTLQLIPSGSSCTGPFSSNGAPGLADSFSLPRACAGAMQGQYAFTVKLVSNAGVVANGTGQLNFDTVGAAITSSSVHYPAAMAGDPRFYGHDGTHLTIRDGNYNVATFVVNEACAGDTSPSLTITGSPTTKSFPRTLISTHSCGTSTAKVWSYQVSADFATAPRWTYGLDNTINIGLSFTDAASPPNNTSGSVSANLTRRIFSTVNQSLSRLAIGPLVYATGSGGTFAYDKSSGAQGWSGTPSSLGPVVATDGSGVFWVNGFNLIAADVNSGAIQQSCSLSSAGTTPKAAKGLVLIDSAHAASSAAYTSPVHCTCTCSPCRADCQTCTGGNGTNAAAASAGGCASGPIVDSTTIVGRNSYVYSLAGSALNATLLSDTTPTGSISTPAAPIIATDNTLGDDSIVTGLANRFDWSASGGTFSSFTVGVQWPVSSGVASGNSLLVGMNGSQAQFIVGALSSSGTVGSAVGAGGLALPPIIDGSAAPAVFLAGVPYATSVTAFAVSPSGLGQQLLQLSGSGFTLANVDDYALAADGTLFVVSGGQLLSIATDSTGSGTGATGANRTAWPAPGRDACRSRNLSVNCPY